MRIIGLFLAFFIILCGKLFSSDVTSNLSDDAVNVASSNVDTIYQFKMKDVTGNDFDFESLKGSVVMIVNVASKCGFTNQYEGLQSLYNMYHEQGLVIIGVPSNNFGQQEPGSNDDIKAFCDLNYNVTFPIMGKVDVKGDNIAPLYRFLIDKERFPKTGGVFLGILISF